MKPSVLAIAALIAASSLPAAAQQTKLLTADKHNEYGIVYTLPVTSLRIEVTARRTLSTAGPYWQYAKKYIGTDRVIKENSEAWTVTDVKVTPYGSPDPDRQYLMQLKPNALTYVCVADDGMLLAVNKEVSLPEAEAELPEAAAEKKNPREYLQYVDEDFISSQSTAKQAQMLAESLMEIREAKIALTRGTAETMPTDGRQLELMLQSLAHQEEAMTHAFTGFTEEQTVTRTYTFTPDEEGRFTLFRMSDFAGFVEADDYAGDPVFVKVTVTDRGELPVDSKGEEKKLPKDAVVYSVPGAARIDISLAGRTLWSDEVQLAQMGVVFGLAPQLFTDKKERSFATFDPATGALREIGICDE